MIVGLVNTEEILFQKWAACPYCALCQGPLKGEDSATVVLALCWGVCLWHSVDWDDLEIGRARSRSHPQFSRIWVAEARGPLPLGRSLNLKTCGRKVNTVSLLLTIHSLPIPIWLCLTLCPCQSSFPPDWRVLHYPIWLQEDAESGDALGNAMVMASGSNLLKLEHCLVLDTQQIGRASCRERV